METMETAHKLDQLIKQLPPEDKNEVADFARFLLEKRTKKKPKRFDFHRLSGMAIKAPLNPSPLFKTEDDLYETTEWGETDSRKQKENLKKLSGMFASKGPTNVSEDVDSHLYE